MAGVAPGDEPAGVTNTSNDGPEAGAGVHLKAQPMFQPAAVVVKDGLVQFPWSCVGPRRTPAGAGAAVDDVDDVDDDVDVVEPPAAVVEVDPPATVVVEPVDLPEAGAVVVAPPGGGGVKAGLSDDELAPTEW